MNTEQNSPSDSDQQFNRIAELLIAAREGSRFNDRHRNELNELLRTNEEHRTFASQFLLDGETLQDLLATEEISALSSGSNHTRSAAKPRWYQTPVLQLAAVVAIVASLLFTLYGQSPIAVIQDEANAVFSEVTTPQNGELENKAYSLIKGMISVEFRNGVSMTVKAPADFEIVDAFRVRLSRGSIRAFAPDSGHGFVIETPDVDIQDLGTEFGVSVNGSSGDSEVHVFDGEVNVNKHRAKETIASLEVGESAKILDGKFNPGGSPADNVYLTPADVSYNRWLSMSEELQNDKDALFYYSFDSSNNEKTLLKDESTQSKIIDGKIQGARWVTGRWPGKQALLFDQQNDAVEITIPGELKQFTFGAWVNVDRLDAPITSIINSMDYREGALHLQISRSGNVFVPAAYPRVRKQKTDVSIPTGKWVLLTAVIDTDAKTGKTWINGQRSITATFDETTFIQPGICLLGAYRTELNGERTKEFRGRMDEVFLIKRTLTQGEIRRIYKHGRPQAQLKTDA